MEKHFFLIVSAMVISLSGCAGSSSCLPGSPGSDTIINTPLPHVPISDDDRGIYLPISNRLSLNVDIECILDFIQDEFEFGPQNYWNDDQYPWIRWRIDF